MKKQVMIMLMMLSVWVVSAQEHPRVEEMHARKWEFIVENAKLTPQQAAKVEPIFMEYEVAVWKLMEQNRDSFKKVFAEKKSQGNPNYEELNDRIINSEMQKAQLLKNYYAKLKKVLPAEIIHKYILTERSFRKELIKDWQGKKRARQQQ